MRILHIATLVTPDGAYGGPTRVAVNHVRELRRQGHDAVLVAGAAGYGYNLPSTLEDVPCILFPIHHVAPFGFSGIVAPSMPRWVAGELATTDLLHIHMSRDMITLPIAELARLRGKDFLIQTHGMIDTSDRVLAKVLDRLVVKRVLRSAGAVFYLTPEEKSELLAITGGNARLRRLQNGVPATTPVPAPDDLNVLYLARMHRRKRPMIFIDMAEELLDAGVSAKFAMVGPEGGELSAVRSRIATSRHRNSISYEGSLAPEHTGERLARCSIYVLPAIDEPYPMTILEALARGRPVVATDSCGLAPIIAEAGAGIVVNDSLQQLCDAVSALAADTSSREAMGNRAAFTASQNFSMEEVIGAWMSTALEVSKGGVRC